MLLSPNYSGCISFRLRRFTLISITFLHVTVCPSDPPTIWSTQPTVYGVQGDSVQLNCTFDGLPVPNITWTSPKGRFLVSQYISTNNFTFLTIPHLGLEDNGTYTCSGNNSIGVSSVSIQLIVQSKLQLVNIVLIVLYSNNCPLDASIVIVPITVKLLPCINTKG